jgi:hypothetical protein
MGFAGQSEVTHVYNQRDIRKLSETCSHVRLILVYGTKLRAVASWAIKMCSFADTESNSRPAIFSHSNPGDGEDDPGVALALRTDPVETSAAARWFALGQIPVVSNWQSLGGEVSVTPVPALVPLLSARPTDNWSIRRLREQELLRSLVTGAAVLRSLAHREGQPVAIEALTLTADDYEEVRLLLQSPAVTSADEPCNPLAKDMVSRANVFSQAKFAGPNAEDNPFRANGSGGGGRNLVTRREIADLGNVRSQLVRQLVGYVRSRSDGYQRFQRMGLVRRPPPLERWRNAEITTLIDFLRPWTAKQVRTHFDQLRRTGMITAERGTANGPWRYVLPEELQGRHVSFRRLPTATELTARYSYE